jgi:Phage minor capsid protein 2
MNEYQDIPESYEADTEEFEALYVMAWLLIIQALMKLIRLPSLPSIPTATQWLQLERQVNTEVQAVISDLNRKATKMAEQKITQAYGEGVKYSRLSLSQEKKIIEEVEEIEDVEEIVETMNDSHKRRLQSMIDQSQDDLLKATGNTHENIKKLVRQVVSKEIAGQGRSGMIGKKSNMMKRVEQQLRKQFLENGIKDADVAIIDRAKRKWKLKTYSEMAVRTKMNMAYIDAIREEALQEGTDLAIISTKPDTYDECKNYEGMIISLNGLTSGYLTYEGIKKTKECFHPNCGHYVRPVADESWIPPQYKDVHKKQMDKYRQTH